jgi:rRNA maturation endonuclease Nob1
MKKTTRLLTNILLLTGLMTGIFSCSTSRMYKNYTYSPKENAPDMGGNLMATPEEKSNTQTNEPVNNPSLSLYNGAAELHNSDLKDVENKEKMDLLQKTFREEMALVQESGENTSNKELIKKVTTKLTETGQINPLSKTQEKKLNKLASKMDKKLKKQGNGIDWRNNTPLELFFMIMSIAGLVLGIVGLAFGWFVFIVFGGLWLYFKLVEDNK